MNEQAEVRLRRRAMRLLGQGYSASEVQKHVHRSRGWLSKWQKRYAKQGHQGLRSQSRRPKHCPRALPQGMTRLIVQTRKRLGRAGVGLVGADMILHELHSLMPHRRLPSPASPASIYRVLHRCGAIRSAKPGAAVTYPWPNQVLASAASIDAMDWTCRYLQGGQKVYAFHSLNLRTRKLHQTLSRDKTLSTAQAHVLAGWETQGIPRYLQLDNDAVFCGGYKGKRVLGQFVRLCLFVGVELIFIPYREPQRNGQVEQVNGLWGGAAFWKRHRFRSFGDVKRLAPRFIDWYQQSYLPHLAYLAYLAQDHASHPHHPTHHPTLLRTCDEHRARLTQALQRLIPSALPISNGRIHFIRQVQADGCIRILNEHWRVSKRLAGRYVWATITTQAHALDIWYQRSPSAPWRLLKHVPYDLGETVHRRVHPFNTLFTMS